MSRDRFFGAMEALFVTILWSSSYILIKIGLEQFKIPPMTLVAFRYSIASIVLIPLALKRGSSIMLSDSNFLLKIAVLGITGYTIAQGFQCLGLFYLPAVSVTFILNFTPVFVLIMGIFKLGERPTKFQLFGLALVLTGAYVFFKDPMSDANVVGVLITLISGLGWATYMVYSRYTFVNEEYDILGLTAFSMGAGTLILVALALVFEGVISISLWGWGIIIWLGLVNTALAFFLWNHALRFLEVFETSILQNTMLIQIAILSWLFLGEQLSTIELISMVTVFFGVLIVQLGR